MRHAINRRRAGFTLVEMIVSIVVAGILVAMLAMFGRWQIQSYFDIANRAALTDAADTALRRMTRDLQKALPNSVRVDSSGTTVFLEFVPIADAGRYRVEQDCSSSPSPCTGDVLNFTAADTSFDVLGPAVTVSAGQQLVVYNLGIQAPTGTTNGSDVYEGYNRRDGVSVSGNTVSFSANSPPGAAAPQALPFPFSSPTNHFHIVDGPVTYECNPTAGQIIRRWGYGFNKTQLTANFPDGTQSAVLVSNVSSCDIRYDGAAYAALQRNGLVSINLTLSGNDETVRLLQQVEIMNTP